MISSNYIPTPADNELGRRWQAYMWEVQKRMMDGYSPDFMFLPGDYQEWWTPRPPVPPKKEEPVKKCTCGAEAVDSPKHSRWCDKRGEKHG